jgi:hypothetical protein
MNLRKPSEMNDKYQSLTNKLTKHIDQSRTKGPECVSRSGYYADIYIAVIKCIGARYHLNKVLSMPHINLEKSEPCNCNQLWEWHVSPDPTCHWHVKFYKTASFAGMSPNNFGTMFCWHLAETNVVQLWHSICGKDLPLHVSLRWPSPQVSKTSSGKDLSAKQVSVQT